MNITLLPFQVRQAETRRGLPLPKAHEQSEGYIEKGEELACLLPVAETEEGNHVLLDQLLRFPLLYLAKFQ